MPLPSSTYFTNTQFTIDCSISQSNTSFEITDEEAKLMEVFLKTFLPIFLIVDFYLEASKSKGGFFQCCSKEPPPLLKAVFHHFSF